MSESQRLSVSNQLTIKVNGVETSFDIEGDEGLSINDYILSAEVAGRFVMVINDEMVPKSAYATALLRDGDTLDIISPISGG